MTTNLDEAGAIVYATCRKNAALALRIAARVTEGGVPLYATTEVMDPEIEAILPCDCRLLRATGDSRRRFAIHLRLAGETTSRGTHGRSGLLPVARRSSTLTVAQ
mgnify:CR=1 FL=1